MSDTPAPTVPSTLATSRVTVMGIGRFGGGAGIIRHLLDAGAEVVATDLLDEHALAATIEVLNRHPRRSALTLRLGRHEVADFTDTDLVVVNPAVPKPWDSPYLKAARAAGVPITTEVRVAVDALPGRRFVGVTGSAGKSSTASMIHHALGELGIPTALGGNIGGSLLESIAQVPERAWVVLELSSFMLHWLGEDRRPWSPDLAVLTNLSPNHLDWHGNFDEYSTAKSAIVRHRESPRLLTDFSRENPAAARAAADSAGDWWSGPSAVMQRHLATIDASAIDLDLLGPHQRRNARLALAAVSAILEEEAIEADFERLHRSLKNFEGLPHRLQPLRSPANLAGMRFIDDSKATTPEATLLALESMDDRSTVHLIVGGADKGVDLAAVKSQSNSVAGLYAIGVVSTSLVGGIEGRSTLSGTLPQAVADAAARMRPGDTLLLSPGCASWDQFNDYRERGKVFAVEVERRFSSSTNTSAAAAGERSPRLA